MKELLEGIPCFAVDLKLPSAKMKTVPLLIALLVGISSAAMQQRPSPVYQPQVTSTGSTTSTMNGLPLKSTSALTNSPMAPAPLNPAGSSQPVAQARESIASEASMLQPTAVNPSTPSQNYYVYYYPNPNNEGSVRQPDNSSIWSWAGWTDVAAGVGSLALVAVGGGILYSRYGNEVKSRALRELKDLSTEDVSRLARKVYVALEKLSNLNGHTE